METPLAVANFFIQKGVAANKPLTPMQVVKLTYIAHGWHLGLAGEPLIDQKVEAWKYGPVISSLYHQFKPYKNNPITSPAIVFDAEGIRYPMPSGDEDMQKFLLKIWDVYKDFNGLQLSTLTHQVGTPWYIVWEQLGGKDRQGVEIPNELIREYYKQKAQGADGHAA